MIGGCESQKEGFIKYFYRLWLLQLPALTQSAWRPRHQQSLSSLDPDWTLCGPDPQEDASHLSFELPGLSRKKSHWASDLPSLRSFWIIKLYLISHEFCSLYRYISYEFGICNLTLIFLVIADRAADWETMEIGRFRTLSCFTGISPFIFIIFS